MVRLYAERGVRRLATVFNEFRPTAAEGADQLDEGFVRDAHRKVENIFEDHE